MADRYNMIGREFGARMDVSPKGVWVRYCDLAAAHAENERLREECAAAWDKCEERRLAQEKAEAEIERLSKAHDTVCGALATAIEGHNQALADAERDMRQRAADSCLGLMTAQSARKFILALPLKHADRHLHINHCSTYC